LVGFYIAVEVNLKESRTMAIFEKRTRIAASAARVFAFHERPDAHKRLTPAWSGQRILEPAKSLAVGSRAVVEVKIGPLKQIIVAEHTAYEPGRMFRDVQVSGPFAKWEHTHLVEPDGESAAFLVDHIEYELPLGILGRIFGGGFARSNLTRLFEYRHQVTKEACEAGE
jgi:ligand-binding SRPBCC domain-containing protein